MSDDLPTWKDLSEHDKAQIVAFLRKVEDEGIDYTWENYPPDFDMAGVLDELVMDGQQIRDNYGEAYDNLGSGDEFWRLYEIGIK